VVKRIVEEGPSTPYLKLNYIIKEIPTDLAQHDIDALLAFITGPHPHTFSDGEWGSLTNDIQEALTVQSTPNQKVANTLIATYRDESRTQMMRDYALQHIGGFAIYLVHTSRSAIGSEQASIFTPLLAELKSASADSSKPWAGTAFNLLGGLLRAAEARNIEIPGLSVSDLTAAAVNTAKNQGAPLNARLPALQFATSHDSPQARSLAREILTSPDPGIMLTQSASATLARLGTKEDLPLLQTASASASRHTAPSIDEAIHSIKAKN